jgi:CHAD domain-containing protein
MSGMARSKWIRLKSPREKVHCIAARMLRSRLKAIAYYLPLAASKAHENAEYVHQLRVWTRRAEAAVDLCRDLLTKSDRRKLRAQLDVLRDAAGAARDADVLHERIARLKPGLGREHLLKLIEQRRCDAQKPVVQVNESLDSGRDALRLLKKVLERIEDQRSKKPFRNRFRKWSREQLRPLVKRFLRRGEADLSDLSRLHKFRIACKRLRYALELVWGALDKKQRKRAYEQLDRLQTHLGSINDRRNLASEIEQALAHTRKRALQIQLRRLLSAERRGLTVALEQWAESRNDKKAQQLARMLKQLVR